VSTKSGSISSVIENALKVYSFRRTGKVVVHQQKYRRYRTGTLSQRKECTLDSDEECVNGCLRNET